MNEIHLSILLHAIWCSAASLGFAILFNTPRRALLYIMACGFVAGLIKFAILSSLIGGGVILAVLAGAVTIGFASLFIANWCNATPTIISISGVISFVPGSYAFKTMMGFIKFTRHEEADVLVKAAHNATMTFFIVLMIALGVALPMLLLRIENVRNIKFMVGERKRDENA